MHSQQQLSLPQEFLSWGSQFQQTQMWWARHSTAPSDTAPAPAPPLAPHTVLTQPGRPGAKGVFSKAKPSQNPWHALFCRFAAHEHPQILVWALLPGMGSQMTRQHLGPRTAPATGILPVLESSEPRQLRYRSPINDSSRPGNDSAFPWSSAPSPGWRLTQRFSNNPRQEPGQEEPLAAGGLFNNLDA